MSNIQVNKEKLGGKAGEIISELEKWKNSIKYYVKIGLSLLYYVILLSFIIITYLFIVGYNKVSPIYITTSHILLYIIFFIIIVRFGYNCYYDYTVDKKSGLKIFLERLFINFPLIGILIASITLKDILQLYFFDFYDGPYSNSGSKRKAYIVPPGAGVTKNINSHNPFMQNGGNVPPNMLICALTYIISVSTYVGDEGNIFTTFIKILLVLMTGYISTPNIKEGITRDTYGFLQGRVFNNQSTGSEINAYLRRILTMGLDLKQMDNIYNIQNNNKYKKNASIFLAIYIVLGAISGITNLFIIQKHVK